MPFLMRLNSRDPPWEIDRETVKIGRARDNDVVLDAPGVSRHHARLLTTDKGYLIVDNASENGVYVNRQRVPSAFLQDGDIIGMGGESLQFSDELISDLRETLHVDRVAAPSRRAAWVSPASPAPPLPAPEGGGCLGVVGVLLLLCFVAAAVAAVAIFFYYRAVRP